MKIILIISLLISSIFAHPHTFIEVYPTIRVQDDNTSVIHFKWVFDDMTSTILIMDLDRDGDGKINAKENRDVEKEYFSTLEDYNYYTFIILDEKFLKFPKVNNFRATIENNRICYYFDIELKHNLKNIVFEFADSVYYVAMVLKKEFVDAKGLDVKVTDVDNDLYFGYRLELK